MEELCSKNWEINVAICSVIRQWKLGKENMSPDFSCGGLIAGNAQGALPVWTGWVLMREDKREREESAKHSGLFRVSKDTYTAANSVKRDSRMALRSSWGIFISNWYTEAGSIIKEKKRKGWNEESLMRDKTMGMGRKFNIWGNKVWALSVQKLQPRCRVLLLVAMPLLKCSEWIFLMWLLIAGPNQSSVIVCVSFMWINILWTQTCTLALDDSDKSFCVISKQH